jgi:hypothetical protein
MSSEHRDAPKKPPVRAPRPDTGIQEAGPRPRKARRAGAASSTKYSIEQKLTIFSGLFRGRADVYPVRWENATGSRKGYMPACSNKFVKPLCDIQRTKCSKCPNQAFEPFDRKAIEKHLRGEQTVGVYPLLLEGTCWFLALDFDDETWRKDVAAARSVCERLGLASYVERSRSGKGAHLGAGQPHHHQRARAEAVLGPSFL